MVEPPVPPDLLCPVWRCMPNHGSRSFTIALDPREARVVLDRGWVTLDGVRYRVNVEGCGSPSKHDLAVAGDGRVMVRCEINDKEGEDMLLAEAEAKRRRDYGGVAWVA